MPADSITSGMAVAAVVSISNSAEAASAKLTVAPARFSSLYFNISGLLILRVPRITE